MRKLEINNKLIEYIKDVLKEIEANSELGIKFKKYWKSLAPKDIVEAALTEPNYYDKGELLYDFIEMKNMRFNETDNTIDFEIGDHVNIFLDRIGFNSSEILQIERKEKLKTLKNVL